MKFVRAMFIVCALVFLSPFLAKGSDTVPDCSQDSEITTFVKNYDAKGSEGISGIAAASNGAMIIAGTTVTPNVIQDSDMYVAKINAMGEREWAKLIQTAASSSDEFSRIISTSDGGFLVVGYVVFYGTGGERNILIKFDASGNKQWAKTIGQGSYNRTEEVVQTKDGGYALLYRHRYEEDGDNHSLVLAKVSSDGNFQWAKNFGNKGLQGNHSLIQTKDQGFLVSASAAITNYAGNITYFNGVTKLNKNGATEWAKIFERIPQNYGNFQKTYNDLRFEPGMVYGISQASDESYLLTGTINSDVLTETTTSNFLSTDIFVSKLNKNGKHIWTESIDLGGLEKGLKIQAVSDGGYVIFGTYDQIGFLHKKAFLVKIASNGAVAWSKILGDGASLDLGNFVKTSDKGFAIGAQYTEGSDESKTAVFKLNSQGEIYENSNYVQSRIASVKDWTRYVLFSKGTPFLANYLLPTQNASPSFPASNLSIRTIVAPKKSSKNAITEKLKGYILLQSENHNRAWYLNPENKTFSWETIDVLADRKTEVENKISSKNLWGKFLLNTMTEKFYYVNPKSHIASYLKNKKSGFNLLRQSGLKISNSDLGKISACREYEMSHGNPNKPMTWVEIRYLHLKNFKLQSARAKKINKELLPVLRSVFENKVKIKDEMTGSMVEYYAYREITKKDVREAKKAFLANGWREIDSMYKQLTLAKGAYTIVMTFNVRSKISSLIEVSF